MDDQSAPSWQYIPPNSGPLPPNIMVVTTTHTGEAMDDTVNRLRIWADGMEKQKNVVVSVLMSEAADEIERLRAERDEAMDEISLLRSTVTDCNIEIEQLRKERDEARRGMCNLLSWEDHHNKFCGSPAEYAKQRGWDCFKEDGP